MFKAYLCVLILTQEPMSSEKYESRVYNCMELLHRAEVQGLDKTQVAAIAYHESRFSLDEVSKAGARGILQVIPKYWCKTKPCDYTQAGLHAWKVYLKLSNGSVREALCRYSTGKPCRRSRAARRYARKVLKTINKY